MSTINNDQDMGFGYVFNNKSGMNEATSKGYAKKQAVHTQLPSQHQVGDEVNVILESGNYLNAKVIKVAFTNSKVLYNLDVVICVEEEEKPGPYLEEIQRSEIMITKNSHLRLYDVDSAFVTKKGVTTLQ